MKRNLYVTSVKWVAYIITIFLREGTVKYYSFIFIILLRLRYGRVKKLIDMNHTVVFCVKIECNEKKSHISHRYHTKMIIH
jgi:hypothetical protein